MSPFLDILRQRLCTLAPKNPLLRNKGAWQWFFLIDIGIINNFASIIDTNIFIVFKLFVIEFTSLLAPDERGQPLFLDFFEKVLRIQTFLLLHLS